jgi:hypothetical protein
MLRYDTIVRSYVIVVAIERTPISAGIWKRNDGFHKIPDSIFAQNHA